jgi:hypothetical protein
MAHHALPAYTSTANQGAGINLAALVRMNQRVTEIQVCMNATANLFNGLILPVSAEGALVRPCLSLIEGVNIVVNTWIAICNQVLAAVNPYSTDELVLMQFDVYAVTGVHDDELILTWVEYIGDAHTRPLNENCLPTMTVKRPLRALVVLPSSVIGGMVHAALLKSVTEKAPKEGRGKAHEDTFNGKLVYYVDKNKLEDRIVLSRVFRRLVSKDMINLMSNTEGLDYDESKI